MEKFFCLDFDGTLSEIGFFDSFDEADQEAISQGKNPIWVLDQEIANQWISVLNK